MNAVRMVVEEVAPVQIEKLWVRRWYAKTEQRSFRSAFEYDMLAAIISTFEAGQT
jgi:hypothetical protein